MRVTSERRFLAKGSEPETMHDSPVGDQQLMKLFLRTSASSAPHADAVASLGAWLAMLEESSRIAGAVSTSTARKARLVSCIYRRSDLESVHLVVDVSSDLVRCVAGVGSSRAMASPAF